MLRDSSSPICCYYCGEPISQDKLTLDHKIPLSRGGKSNLSNLVFCCWNCNQEKDDMTDSEYREYLDNRSILSGIVPLSDVRIPPLFASSTVSQVKLERAINILETQGILECPVFLNNYIRRKLVDGYSRYIAAQMLNIEFVYAIYIN